MKHVGTFALVLLVILPVVLGENIRPWKDEYVPVFVMLPLDTITNDGQLKNPDQLKTWFDQLSNANVDGVLVDVWWGITEGSGPQQYSWDSYHQLIDIVSGAGLHASCIMSFHQCGGNVGDTCNIPLPSWVLSVGDSNPEIFYTDQNGHRDQEYLSLGADNETIFQGRSPVQMYADYVESFVSSFHDDIKSGTVSQIQIGLGPAGEMRYPSYQLSGGLWSFCGIGEFQCYDKYMLADLADAASAYGHPEWGHGGPDNAGNYNSHPSDTGFFAGGNDNFASEYGQFFLNWYSGKLMEHGDQVLGAVRRKIGNSVELAGKVAGIHWWYFDASHAAELTTGYKNDKGNGYDAIASVFSRNNATFCFTCFEMKDSEQSGSCDCGPQELVAETAKAAHNRGLRYASENALPRFDTTAFGTIEDGTRTYGPLSLFSYLRLDNDLLSGSNWSNFCNFVNTMHSI